MRQSCWVLWNEPLRARVGAAAREEPQREADVCAKGSGFRAGYDKGPRKGFKQQ